MNDNNLNNGAQNRVLWWIVGSILAPLTLALSGTMLNLGITSAQRISALEAQFDAIQHRLDGIDRKLDRALEAKK